MSESESEKLLKEFTAHCEANPTERFWQALRNWSGHNFVLVSKDRLGVGSKDTFYWRGRAGVDADD